MPFSQFGHNGRGLVIALIVLSFWAWWPLGLAMAAYAAFMRGRFGWTPGAGRWQSAMPEGVVQGSRGFGPWASWGSRGCGTRRGAGASSGNRAFDEYRTETLSRLEEEQREFFEYLERLRKARDKSEFDSFMAERRDRQKPTTTDPAG